MNMMKIREKIASRADKLVRNGATQQDVAFELLRQGLSLFRANDEMVSDLIVRESDSTGSITVEVAVPGHKIAVVPLVAPNGISVTRVAELLDYASCYGDFDENTPNGTPSDSDVGNGMNDYRRGAIVLLKKLTGELPDDFGLTFPDHQHAVERLTGLIQEAGDLVAGYAELHLAKSPPDLDKAERNIRMAEKLFMGIGVDYTAPTMPVSAARDAVEAHSPFPAVVDPSKLSGDPLDRKATLAWLDMVLDGCTKSGQREAYQVVLAIRGALAQHLEAAPIDFAVALNAFYDDVFERNVKAGWWSDLATKQPKKRSVGELFILFVTELCEAYEAYLTGEPDDKLPEFPGLGVELGDLQIRLADFCGALRAGRIVENTETANPGDKMFNEICMIARHYESIRKTPEANGDPETGEPLDPQDVGLMVVKKLEFNAGRADHKPENRMKEGGKQT